MSRIAIPESARVSRGGFRVAPKQASHLVRTGGAVRGTREVHDKARIEKRMPGFSMNLRSKAISSTCVSERERFGTQTDY